MGVGLISLATLFPLGLVRLREATRNSRSGLAFETAADDMDARDLLFKPSFPQTWYGTRDPFVQDVDVHRAEHQRRASPRRHARRTARYPANDHPGSCQRPAGLLRPALAVGHRGLAARHAGAAHDPTLDFQPATPPRPTRPGSATGLLGGDRAFLRNDPATAATPSAHGLQRLTNFIPWSSDASLTRQYPLHLLNNLDSPTLAAAGRGGRRLHLARRHRLQPEPAGRGSTRHPSPVLPDMSAESATGPAPQADYRYTWFFTGRQARRRGQRDPVRRRHRRLRQPPVRLRPARPAPASNAPAGETVVEAIFGYRRQRRHPLPTGNAAVGYAPVATGPSCSAGPTTMPDPEVRVGGWIADVTYERQRRTTYASRSDRTGAHPFARCHWYQIAKRTDPEPDADVAGARTTGGWS